MERLPHSSSTKPGVKPKGFPSRLARKFAGKRIRRSDQFAWRAADDAPKLRQTRRCSLKLLFCLTSFLVNGLGYNALICGGSSSIGRASDCGSDGCGFNSRLPPQF